MTPELKRCRALISEKGWVGPDLEPFCLARDGDGRLWWCLDAHHPKVVQVSVEAALHACGLGIEAWDLIELSAKAPNGLGHWLRASDRRTGDVLRVIAEAIGRSKGERHG